MSVVRYGKILSMAVILVLAAVLPSEAVFNIDPISSGVVSFFTNAFVQGIDTTLVSQVTWTNFVVQYRLAPVGSGSSTNWGGAPDWDGAMVYWKPMATSIVMGTDLSGYTSFVFGVRGTTNKVKIEFESSDSAKSIGYLNAVTNFMQYYQISASSITNNRTKIKSINFVVNYAGSGAVNTGQFEVVVQGLSSNEDWQIYPGATTDVTRLPFTNNPPRLSDVDGTEIESLSTSNFVVHYNLAPASSGTNGSWHGAPDWDAAMLYWYPWASNAASAYNLSSVTTFVFAVRSTSMAQRVKLEFEAVDSNKTVAVLRDVTNVWRYYHIPCSNIVNLATNMKSIVFVANYGSEGVGSVNTGTFEVIVQNLTNPPPSNVIYPLSTGDVTRLPGGPRVSEVDGTEVSQYSTSNFVVNYNLAPTSSVSGTWHGAPDWDAAMLYWTNFSFTNLSSITTFVFKVSGAATALNVEFESATNALATSNFVKTIFTLVNVSNSWQYYHIPAVSIAYVTNMRTITFAANYSGVGTVKTGAFEVVVHGLTYDPITVISNYAGSMTDVTVLPGGPYVSGVDTTQVAQLSSTNFIVNYNLAPSGSTNGTWRGAPDWDAAMVSWGYQNNQAVSADLSGGDYTSFVFAVKGDANKVKVEFQDINDNKTIVVLQNVTNLWHYYRIPTSIIPSNSLKEMKSISFVAVYGTGVTGVGLVSTGTFEVVVGGLTFYLPISPTNVGSATVLPNFPGVTNVGGGDGTLAVTNSPTTINVSYNVMFTNWAGAAIQYGSQGANDSQDLSRFTNLVFGLRGGSKNVKIEFLEFREGVTNTATFICTDVAPTNQYYSISLTNIGKSVSVSNINVINFVVDIGLVESGSLVSNLFIESGGLRIAWFLNGTNTGSATVLPGSPSVVPVAGATCTTINEMNSTNIQVGFDFFNCGGWSGATILYDDYGSTNIEYQDFSGTNFTNLVFGLWSKGAANPNDGAKNIKVEFTDISNRTAIVYCTNVGATVKYYSINMARIASNSLSRGWSAPTSDISRIKAINFVVDASLVAMTNEPIGTLGIVSGGLNPEYNINPQPTGTLTQLPPTPRDVTTVGGAAPGTRVVQYDSGHFRVYYDITSASNWSGASILYDNFGSESNEVGDFSTRTSMVFAVKGLVSGIMKIEFVDFNPISSTTNKMIANLLNVNESQQYYDVNMITMSNKGLRVNSIMMINFVVSSNQSGHFDVFTAGLTNSVKIYPWWLNYDLTPEDWPYGDGDYDGANNLTEYIGGTNPTNSNSAPLLSISSVGKTNAQVSIGGFNNRMYSFYRTDNLRTGIWSEVGHFFSSADALVQFSDDMTVFSNMFYRCSILYKADVTRLSGQPAVGQEGTEGAVEEIVQNSSEQFTVKYYLRDGYYAAAVLSYNNQDLSGYSNFTFAISGDPQSVQFEFVSAYAGVTNKAVGTFQNVTNSWNTYTINKALLTSQGLDLAHVYAIKFLVNQWNTDYDHWGSGSKSGSFSVRTWGLLYTIQTSGSASGAVTKLLTPPLTVRNLGGAQSTNNWLQTGATNVVVTYTVSASSNVWDGVSLTNDYSKANYSNEMYMTFGVKGTPEKIQLEFQDTTSTTVIATFNSITNTLKYYTVSIDDLEAAGLNSARIKYINFVVKQNLAGSGKYTGDFTVVTDGLAP
jgi:hypothetical protein